MGMEKYSMKKVLKKNILPEYLFHLEQIFLGSNIHWQRDQSYASCGLFK